MTSHLSAKDRRRACAWALLLLLGAPACSGQIDQGGVGGPGSATGAGGAGAPPVGAGPSSGGPAPAPGAKGDVLADPLALGATAARRHSREELRQTLVDLLGVDVRDRLDRLPNDPATTLFDNDAEEMVPSAALLEGVRAIADTAAQRALAGAGAGGVEALTGCKPAAADDAACLTSFIKSFGRRAWRRPLEAEEVTRFAEVGRRIASTAGDFAAGVEVVVRALLQAPQFLYRIELGMAPAGASEPVRLTGFEVASRLSYLFWGSTPSDGLLDAAARGALAQPEGVRAQAQAMLQDPRAAARLRRFHALWFSYETIEAPEALAASMRRETDALVDRQTAPGASWLGLFDAQETFVDNALARHYGLAAPANGAAWTTYGATGRRGLLSHGAVLTNGQKHGKTSVVQRGLFVLRRLLCKEVPDPPPELEVDVDAEPKSAKCKVDSLRAHSAAPACSGCHASIDPIGAGLEGFDLLGQARTHDETGCVVDDKGELPVPGAASLGAYRGPAELGARLLSSGYVAGCLAEQMFTFAQGRRLLPSDDGVVRALQDRLPRAGNSLTTLLLDFVSTPAFLHRLTD